MAKPSANAYILSTHALALGLITAVPCREGSGSTAQDFIDSGRSYAVAGWTTSGGEIFANGGSAGPVQRIRYFCNGGWPATIATRVLAGPISGANNYYFRIAPTDNSYAHFDLVTANTTNVFRSQGFGWGVSGTTVIVPGSIYNVAVSFNGTTLTQYVNGVVDATLSTTWPGARSSYGNGNPIAIGAPGTPFCSFSYMWDRALSSTEIASVFANPYQMFSEPTGGGGSSGTTLPIGQVGRGR